VASRNVVELIAKVPIFSGCTKRELDAVLRAAKDVSHPEGHVVAREGDRGIGFFLILDGTAKVTRGGRHLATLGRGDFFGEISLLDRGPRTATVTATSPVQLIGLTAWVFRGLLEEHPTIAMKMLEVIASRLRRVSKDTS
jgi:CRP/FNR family transcriptional regulator, cyclic AMP receptor protein